MRLGDRISCPDFPCQEVVHERFSVPTLEVDATSIHGVMVCEAPAPEPTDDLYAAADSFFMRTTRQAFGDAGFPVSSMSDILGLGVYVTTAVKCAKTGYAVPPAAIGTCSHLLEAELALFPHLVVIAAMGEVAIRAVNEIGRRRTGARVVPAGSTWKLRGHEYRLGEVRVLPSYLQTGRSYLIETSKQRMIAEDIRTALELMGHRPAA